MSETIASASLTYAELFDQVMAWQATALKERELALKEREQAELYRSAQGKVFAAVEARGYRSGWTDEQFLARQVCKLQEELSELCAPIANMPSHLEDTIDRAGYYARMEFNGIDRWDEVFMASLGGREWLEDMKKETADCLVVLFNIAATLERISGMPFDLVQAAVAKATADVQRGVRS